MKKNELRLKLEELHKNYEDIKNKINLEKANGSLSKLYNLREEFDENFDIFFDDEDLRKKYNDYDHEEEIILFEKSNTELLEELDEEDLNGYIEFYGSYISALDDELNELQNTQVNCY